MRTLTKSAQKNQEQEKLPDGVRSLGITVKIPAQPKCVVANCFTEKIFAYRDSDFDNLLPKTLPASAAVSVNRYELTRVTTEAELANSGKPLTNLSQIEDLILRTEKSGNTGLVTNGNANIFFLLVNSCVFAVRAYRYSGGWGVLLYHFDAGREWCAGIRFFSSAT